MAFHRKCCATRLLESLVNRQFFPVCTVGLVDGSQRANVWRYVAPVVENNAENLNEEKVLMNAKHVRFFSHRAWLRPLPQRGLNLRRGSDRYPNVDWTLGDTGSCQSQPSRVAPAPFNTRRHRPWLSTTRQCRS